MKQIIKFILVSYLCIPNSTNTTYAAKEHLEIAKTRVSLLAENEKVNLSFRLLKNFYEIGDTIIVEVKIINKGVDDLLVWDPKYYRSNGIYMLDGAYNNVNADLSAGYDGHPLNIRKLTLLNPSDSVMYKLYTMIDSSITIKGDNYDVYYVDCGAVCWQYSPSFKYLTEGNESIVYYKGVQAAAELLFSALFYYVGEITVFVFKDLDKFELSH